MNHDGCADLLIGTRGPVTHIQSALSLHLGSTKGVASQPSWRVEGDRIGFRCGWTATGVGDVNGDGLDDVLMGVPDFSPGESLPEAGLAVLFLGSTAGLSAAPAWSHTGTVRYARFGSCVARLGDLDGDGCADFAIGSPGGPRNILSPESGSSKGENRSWPGCVEVWHGRTNLPASDPIWRMEGDAALSSFGWAVAGGKDLTGDGVPDLVVTAPRFSGAFVKEGRVALYAGLRKGFATKPLWTVDGGDSGVSLGAAVVVLDDANGDRQPDLAVGAPYYSQTHPNGGRVDVFLGGKGRFDRTNAFRFAVPLPLPEIPPAAALPLRSILAAKARAQWPLLATAALIILLLTAVLGRLVRRRQQAAKAAAANAALEKERRRLARDLHDQLGPELTTLALHRGEPPGANPAPNSPSRIGGQISEIVWLTKPENDTLPNFADYVSEHAARVLASAGVRANLDVPTGLPPRPIAGEFRRELFLAFKEALANAVAHAHATEIRVSFVLANDSLELTVADNGSGFDPSTIKPAAGHGNGLGNLRSRLQELGGTCEIHSAPGQGTRVSLRAPLTK